MYSKNTLEIALEVEDIILAPREITVSLVRKKKSYARN